MLAAVGGALAGPPGADSETVYPTVDGTLADGGSHGEFDGVPDEWDWTFDGSGYEGVITLTTETPESSLEQRVVWEYNLGSITRKPPVSAKLRFTLRGVSVLPFPDVEVHIYSYPADLTGTPEDYSAGPAVFQGSVIVRPLEDSTTHTLDVSRAVNEARLSANNKVAFRFQVNPATQHTANQAFMDALDSDPTTKPHLTITEAARGDADGDGDVDLRDVAAFQTCFGRIPDGGICSGFSFTVNDMVDLDDYALFRQYCSGPQR